MSILTAIAPIDGAGPSLYKINEISQWLARPGQADGHRLMYETVFPPEGLVFFEFLSYTGFHLLHNWRQDLIVCADNGMVEG